MCHYSPENQLCPGLHQKKHGQQVKGGDPATLLCGIEASREVQHPSVESSVQKRHGLVGVHPEQDHKKGMPHCEDRPREMGQLGEKAAVR